MSAQQFIDIEKQAGTPETGESPNGSGSHHHGFRVARVTTSGDNQEILHLGDTKIYKEELMAAFGGSLNVGLSTAPTHKFASK